MSEPVRMIPLSEPEISGNEWKYIKECLDAGWVSSAGTYVDKFEKTVAAYAGTKYAVATVNGTSALHASLIACSIGPDDEVIVPTLTFIAPVNAVRYCGAHPVFMDCTPDTLCIDVQKIIVFLKDRCEQRKDGFTYNKKTGRRIKAIIPVHVFGHPADMEPLRATCESRRITIIEDATESLGSEYNGKMTGSLGKIGCFSFNGNKIITTGGGGMVVTDNKALSERIRHLCTQAKKDPFEYDHDEIGYNYRLTNLQAAMGVAQMERLEEFIETKRKNAAMYRELLSDMDGIEFLWEKPCVRNNFWFYTMKVSKKRRKGLMDFLLSKKIQIRPVWKLIHTLPMYNDSEVFDIKSAFEVYKSCINLPCSVGITEGEVHYIAKNIKAYFKKV